MVAYSFKQRFVVPIQLGLQPGPWLPGMKRQTIRADRARHARPKEQLQLYRGMRTKQCFLIGRAVCKAINKISIAFDGVNSVTIEGKYDVVHGARPLDEFARRDGFGDWGELCEFWEAEHAAIVGFNGVIIFWEPETE